METENEFDDLPTMDVHEVAAGDLLFTARPGRLQTLVELAGDPWRHVGVAVEVDGEIGICEVAGHTFQFRPLHRIAAPPHTAVGVARFGGEAADCASAAADWVASKLDDDNLYAWDDLILTGVLLVVRRRAPAMFLDEVLAVVHEAERLASEAPPPEDRRSFTCASFAFHAYAQAGAACAPDITIEPVRSRPARHRVEQADRPPSLAELVAEMDEGRLDNLVEPLANHSLLELSGISAPPPGPRVRISATSRMSANQFADTTRNLVRLFANVRTRDLPPRLVLDERWVSPGDLWRLEGLALRALLPIADAT